MRIRDGLRDVDRWRVPVGVRPKKVVGGEGEVVFCSVLRRREKKVATLGLGWGVDVSGISHNQPLCCSFSVGEIISLLLRRFRWASDFATWVSIFDTEACRRTPGRWLGRSVCGLASRGRGVWREGSLPVYGNVCRSEEGEKDGWSLKMNKAVPDCARCPRYAGAHA